MQITIAMKMKKLILKFLLIMTFAGCLKETPPNPPKLLSENSLELAACSDTNYEAWEISEYVLPYPIGESYNVNLSHCGGSYHSAGQPDQFAIDFNMSIGSTITASRAGRVVHVEESGFDGGFPNNLVIVQHTDGTFAQYMHLTHEGANVEVGNTVKKGDVIGLSGNTGLAGYPHLHFVATTSGSWQYPYISFPTTFSNTTENPKSLEQGKNYKALPYY